jgi:hypothetical protein
VTFSANNQLDSRVIALGADARILDVGGWFSPYPLATHVVDIMPYETRSQGYFPEPRPMEKFRKDGWIVADITDPDFRLPYEDNYFDFSVCMQTVEDLHEVRPLFRELSRVSAGGYIETPSRATEQTVGICDRSTTQVGFNHHKWIVDICGDKLVLFDKDESFYQPRHRYVIPLNVFEGRSEPRNVEYYWSERIKFELCFDPQLSRRRSRSLRSDLNISFVNFARDCALRSARRIRNKLRGVSEHVTGPHLLGENSSLA